MNRIVSRFTETDYRFWLDPNVKFFVQLRFQKFSQI